MRIREIVDNIEQQIKLSGYEGQLGGGVVITGGASQLKNLHLYLEKKLSMPVRKASAKKTSINNFPELANDPSLTQALGLLLYGWENCEAEMEEIIVDEEPDKQVEKPKKQPKPKGRGFFGKVEDMFGGMFDDTDEEN